ncbi:hypothetical protein OHB56_37930 [Streptomyces sp. NBC_01635]|uniref:hypothetical protein n=1 Tax=Streptomyces sp. NBC_01635 TaxID=2975904 RepID=UPI00386B560F|nr:hypothetical protein OHB56_37930 [Streptomyces sp. NBC_01635]
MYASPLFLGDHVLGPVGTPALRPHALGEDALDEAWPRPVLEGTTRSRGWTTTSGRAGTAAR